METKVKENNHHRATPPNHLDVGSPPPRGGLPRFRRFRAAVDARGATCRRPRSLELIDFRINGKSVKARAAGSRRARERSEGRRVGGSDGWGVDGHSTVRMVERESGESVQRWAGEMGYKHGLGIVCLLP